MSYLRNANERIAYSKTFYPDSEVYINKLGIRDLTILEATERRITEDRADEGFPVRAHYRTYAGFKAIHRHLFQDLYKWAEARTELHDRQGSCAVCGAKIYQALDGRPVHAACA